VVCRDHALIEGIDFLSVWSEQPALELGRRPVAQRGVQAFWVVDLLEKPADAGAGFGQIAIFRPLNFLVFQGLDKRFTGCVVPGIPLARPADLDAVVAEPLGIVAAGVLHAAIGVMHQSG
jgi:hypothetical protein